MTAAKLAAHHEAARQEQLAAQLGKLNALPRTTVLMPAKRDVIFHLTPFAPGCERAQVGDKAREYVVYGSMPGQALHRLFRRLEVPARQVGLTSLENLSVAVHPVARPDQPWAFIWHGLSHQDALTALDGLQRMEAQR